MAEIQKIKTNEINDVDLNLIQNGSIIGGNTNVVSNMTTNIEEIDLTPITKDALNTNSIDFSRIASSANEALNGVFLNENSINKDYWNSHNLTYKTREDGTIAIYAGESILGFTDQAGIANNNINSSNTSETVPTIEQINPEPQVANPTPINHTTENLDGIPLQYDEAYDVSDVRLTKRNGRINFNGHQETYYSEKVKPGGGLDIPGRHVAQDGTIRDELGYICIAANNIDLPKGSTVMTSLGPAKVYDTGEMSEDVIDIYVSW